MYCKSKAFLSLYNCIYTVQRFLTDPQHIKHSYDLLFKGFKHYSIISMFVKAASSVPLLLLNDDKEISLGIIFYTKSNFLAYMSVCLLQRNSPKLGWMETEEDGSSLLMFTLPDAFL